RPGEDSARRHRDHGAQRSHERRRLRRLLHHHRLHSPLRHSHQTPRQPFGAAAAAYACRRQALSGCQNAHVRNQNRGVARMNSLLEEVIEAWEGTRDGVIAEVENIPPKQFDFRPAAESRSVSELTRHIMEVSLMMVGELTREDTNLTRAPWPKPLAM